MTPSGPAAAGPVPAAGPAVAGPAAAGAAPVVDPAAAGVLPVAGPAAGGSVPAAVVLEPLAARYARDAGFTEVAPGTVTVLAQLTR